MEKYIDEIMALRQVLKDADLSDEEREAAEASLATVEGALSEEREVTTEESVGGETTEAEETEEREVNTEEEEETPAEEKAEERQADPQILDLTPITEALQEVGRTLTEGQAAVLEEIQAMRSESTASTEEETEEETTSDDEATRSALDGFVTQLNDLRTLIEEALPLRRGAGPDKDTVNGPVDAAQRLAEELKDEKNPEIRLRKAFDAAGRN